MPAKKPFNSHFVFGDLVVMELENKAGKVVAYSIFNIRHLPRVRKYRWSLSGNGYTQARVEGSVKTLHAFLLNGKVIDHSNRDKLDNTDANLRLANQAKNTFNIGLRRDNKTGYRGVVSKGERYYAYVSIRRERHWLGSFSTAKEAARARDKKALELHGEFAFLNLSS